jgi:hypothetical protein
MKTKSIFIFGLAIINLNINTFASSSLRFEEEIPSLCGIVFQNRVGITFKNEETKYFSNVILYSNNPKNDLVILRIKKLLKAHNLNNIPNADIFLVFNKINKIRLSQFSGKNIAFKRGKYQVHLEINRPRTHIYSGIASLEFEIHTICK